MLSSVKVVPPWTEPRAPAEHGSYREARTGKISPIKVSTLSGEDHGSPITGPPSAYFVLPTPALGPALVAR